MSPGWLLFGSSLCLLLLAAFFTITWHYHDKERREPVLPWQF